jgi:hypothetical protein
VNGIQATPAIERSRSPFWLTGYSKCCLKIEMSGWQRTNGASAYDALILIHSARLIDDAISNSLTQQEYLTKPSCILIYMFMSLHALARINSLQLHIFSPMLDINFPLRFNFGDRVVMRVEIGLHDVIYDGGTLGIMF